MDLTDQAVTGAGSGGTPEPGPSAPAPSKPRSPAPESPAPDGLSGSDRPRLARHVRLAFDKRRDCPVLLLPETVVVLNATGAAILRLSDGERTVEEIVAELGAEYAGVSEDEVRTYLAKLVGRRCVELVDG